MRRLALALACLFISGGLAAAPAKKKSAQERFLLDREAEMTKDGWSVKSKLLAPSSDGGKLAVYIFEDAGGKFDRLKVWHMKALDARQVYVEIDSSFKIDLEAIHDKGKLPDLYGDGSRTLAYRMQKVGGAALRLIRFAGYKPTAEPTPLPDGWLQDLDGDGRLEVLARTLPLGRLYTIECKGFHGMVRGAYRTTVYEFQEGHLVSASSRHPGWFNEHIARLEGDLASADPRSSQRHGDFVSGALSLYFDHEQRGLGQKGWRRFNELFAPGAGDPPGTSDCIRQVKADLRRRLDVPDAWE